MANRTAVLVAVLQDAVSGPAKKISGELDNIGKSSHGLKGALTGAGGALLDVAKVGVVAATAGVTALAGGLAFATKAAAEEEVGLKRLDQALRNNVKGFTGNTDAIEKTIAKRQQLAFADDELRDSLGQLVSRTGNVDKAFALQATAMDLARAKGIDLATATGIIGKVYSGNVGILARYGIAVDKGASSTEALAAIQKAAAGQAEAYGQTTQGAFEAFQIAIDNVVEDIGAALLPVATQFARFVSADLVPAISEIANRFNEWVAANRPLIDQVTQFVATTLRELVTTVMTQVIPAFVDVLERIGSFGRTLSADAGPAVAGIVGKLGELAQLIATKVVPIVVDLAQRVWEGGLNRVVAAGVKVIGSAIDILVALVTWITTNTPLLDAFRLLADGVGRAFGFVADVVSDAVDFLGSLGDAIRANKPVMDALATVGNIIAGAFRAAASAIDTVIGAIREVIRIAGEALAALASLGSPTPTVSAGGPRGPNRALGGPVSPGTSYLVGERGPELLTMGAQSGFVTPNAGGGGAPVVVQLNLDGRKVAELVDERLFFKYRTAARTGAAV